MARSKSAVLSPADKKAVVTDIKARLKDAEAQVKQHTGVVKASKADFDKVHKAAQKMVTDAEKIHNANVKAADKSGVAASKLVTKLQGELDAITQKAS